MLEFEDIFTKIGDEYGQTNGVYRCIDDSDAQPICHPLHRVLLAKQPEVDWMLKDIKV